FGLNGEPILSEEGFAKVIRAYDERGNKTEEAYYGIDGAPKLHRKGYAKEVNLYDNYGNIAETQYFDLDGSKVTPLSE
ncbi:MAG: hypothetical protein LZF85_10190, partial [Nitrosomonas sp.]|uniref:hypothetical protein n=1 Tax=Nitrosomonas sp. TaxID=42353 RepID=UPI0025F900E0